MSSQRKIAPSPFRTTSESNALGEFARRPEQNRRDLESMGYVAERWVCGRPIPPFQRELGKWSDDQKSRFIASAWMGFDIGSIVLVAETQEFSHETFDGMVIDGQHRLQALEEYVNDQFRVFGLLWSELADGDHRAFFSATTIKVAHLHCHDEQMLRVFYDILNFSGVSHEDSERASEGTQSSAYAALSNTMTK